MVRIILHGVSVMGIEVAIALAAAQVGLGLYGASQSVRQGKKDAAALIEQGNIEARNKAKEIQARAASQKTSFLNSGLMLEGTPMNVIESTFNTGAEDLGNLARNYNTAAKNAISKGRSQAISSLVGSFASAGTTFAGAGGFSSAASSTAPVVNNPVAFNPGQTAPWSNPGQSLPWRLGK